MNDIEEICIEPATLGAGITLKDDEVITQYWIFEPLRFNPGLIKKIETDDTTIEFYRDRYIYEKRTGTNVARTNVFGIINTMDGFEQKNQMLAEVIAERKSLPKKYIDGKYLAIRVRRMPDAYYKPGLK